MAQSQTLERGLGGEEGGTEDTLFSPRVWEAETGEQSGGSVPGQGNG